MRIFTDIRIFLITLFCMTYFIVSDGEWFAILSAFSFSCILTSSGCVDVESGALMRVSSAVVA